MKSRNLNAELPDYQPHLRCLKQEDLEVHHDQISRWLWEISEGTEASYKALAITFNESKQYAWCLTPDTLDGVILANLRLLEGERIFSVSCAAGSTDGCWDVISEGFEREAVLENCARMEIKTRPGVAKKMRPHGWKTNYIVLTKEV